MNILRAEAYLNAYGQNKVPLQEVYDDDEMLQSAVNTLFPGFEYPEYSHLTLEELRARYKTQQRPLTS